MFFTFNQNNSGGRFVEDNVFARFMIIEADSAEEANLTAERLGIYFNGCAEGSDCPCCGDRWHMTWECDANSEPMIYNEPVNEYKDDWLRQSSENPAARVFYKDGTVTEY